VLVGSKKSEDVARGTALLKKACEGGVDRACKKLAGGGPP
jgi:hypothetical protein